MKKPIRFRSHCFPVIAVTLVPALLAACGGEDSDVPGGGGGGGVGGLGMNPAVLAPPVVVTDMRLSAPRDLDFNPRVPGELWVVNGRTHAVTLIHDATAADVGKVRLEYRRDPGYTHFMPSPSSLDFGGDATNDAAPNAARTQGTFATCQESRDPRTDPTGRMFITDFMGPVLWPSDLTVFTLRTGDLPSSHLDMLHQSPLCMGITWEGVGNVYWTYNGLSRSVARYDFELDHGVGNDDHSDGMIWRFLNGELGYVEGVPSHLFYDVGEGALYIADTGNGRILRLHPGTSMKTARILPAQDEREGWDMKGAEVREVVTQAAGLFQRPSGLEIAGDHLYVSDNAASTITKLKRDGSAVRVVKIDVPPGSLSGMSFGPDNKLYFVDMVGNRVLRMEAF